MPNGFIDNTTRFSVDPPLGRLNISSPEHGLSGRIDGVEVGYLETIYRLGIRFLY